MHYKIIDFHVHCGVAHNTCYPVSIIKRYIKSNNISTVVLSSLSGVFDVNSSENDLKQISKYYPSVVSTYWLNPYQSQWENRLKKNIIPLNIKGIKLSPTANIYEPEYKFLKPVFEFCRKYKLFITTHTDIGRSSPHKFVRLIEEYPDVDIVLIHTGEPVSCIYIAREFKNVYLETSFLEGVWQMAPLQIALDVIGDNRILFGTDYPIGFMAKNTTGRKRTLNNIVECYKDLFPKNVVRNILFNNAQKLLKKYGVYV